jgi:hypothetical protein
MDLILSRVLEINIMDKIPTTEELISATLNIHIDPIKENINSESSATYKEIKLCMIEFAKLHVQAALKAAEEQCLDKHGQQINEFKNAYPLDKII